MATANFNWTEISQSQSSKYATHNTALGQIDGKLAEQSDFSIAGTGIINLAATTLTGITQYINFTGTLTGNRTVRFPGGNGAVGGGTWWVKNSTTGAFTVTIDHATGSGNTFVLPRNDVYFCMISDQTNQHLLDLHEFPERNTTWATSDISFEDPDRYYVRTLAANLTLTLSNPILGKSVLLELDSGAGSYTFTLPGTANLLSTSGTYDTTGTVNQIRIECVDASTPKYLVWIDQE